MATPNAFINWPKTPGHTNRSLANPYSYLSDYDKHRRYYFRDYDDRYQIDTLNEQQFESIIANPKIKR